MAEAVRYDRDADGVVVLTIDVPDQPQNVITDQFQEDFIAAVDRLCADPAASGAVLASAKSVFMAGADLKGLERLIGRDLDVPAVRASIHSFKAAMRRLETWGRPVAAALEGHALGGGFELCLACHRRYSADLPHLLVGLPEVTVGLLPGGGGVQRLLRLVGPAHALPLLLKGTTLAARDALAAGLVDELVAPGEAVGRAKAWVRAAGPVRQPWDAPHFRPPGDADLGQLCADARARIEAETMDLYPAPLAIVDCLRDGAVLPIDEALALETESFLDLLQNPVAGAIIRTSFLNRKSAEKLRARPPEVPRSRAAKLGVVGAGLMGAGIACVAADAGLTTVLIDRDPATAERGRSYTERALSRRVAKGQMTSDAADQVLERIRPTTEYAELSDADLVIEAVFEDPAVKADVTRLAEAVLPAHAVYASNTSTLPITGLAAASCRPDRFIGLHFFSPVERMALVEVICGVRTSRETLARALDFVRQIRKTPIVVKDSRGFYTSRVFGTFTSEGLCLLYEGVEPALIEDAARRAGMPVGPLALLDEVSLDLVWTVIGENRKAHGAAYQAAPGDAVVDLMVNELGRRGRRGGGGFYDYPADRPKTLWSQLRDHFPPAAVQPDLETLKRRLLYRQAVEAARCVAEGIVSPADADLGAVLGWGFPAYTGGPISLIDAVGASEFVSACDAFARAVGPRFAPPEALRRVARGREARSLAEAWPPLAP